MKGKIPKSKHKVGDKIGEWKRIFQFLPIETEDGYRVYLHHVWRRKVPTGLDWEFIYHTNPDGREDLRRGTGKADLRLENIGMTDEIRAWSQGKPLTEGKMRHGSNPMPPVKRPKRPPPPPAPPAKICATTTDVPGRMRVVVEEKGREAKVCPDCGTIDCYKGPAKFSISGAGVLSTTSEDIMKSCKTRQQLNALERLNINGRKKSTLGEPKELPKNQKLGFYTGSTGPK